MSFKADAAAIFATTILTGDEVNMRCLWVCSLSNPRPDSNQSLLNLKQPAMGRCNVEARPERKKIGHAKTLRRKKEDKAPQTIEILSSLLEVKQMTLKAI